jgi:2,3-bisphosphoglycerate-independent phosphoglycerate mutase
VNGPFLFCVLDGWGVRRGGPGDARALARTPFLDALEREWPTATLAASGLDVGLPEGVMGNSEVGHLNLGAGRVVDQDIVRIDKVSAADAFAENPVVAEACRVAREGGGRLHLLGLVSDGRVHSSDRHLAALLRAAARLGLGGDRTVIHAFLDGRDTPPSSAPTHLARLLQGAGEAGAGVVGTVSGRYWSKDRDKRWERTERAWKALALGDAPRVEDPLAAIAASHGAGKTDEFVEPVVVGSYAGIGAKDAVLHANFRPDRARQTCRALADPAFAEFPRGDSPRPAFLGTMTLYDASFPYPVAFPPLFVTETLGACWAAAGLKQLRIAETEKYAHVTYFFSGRDEKAFAGEERVLVPSPKVATYDLQPSMSAAEVTDRLLAEVARKAFAGIVLNYANPDMVGHTGVIPATVAALETVDRCLARAIPAVLEAGGAAVVTADHGNCEEMLDAKGGVKTSHSMHPVPAIFAGPPFAGRKVRAGAARLADVAPTVLRAMGLPVPKGMTGENLV